MPNLRKRIAVAFKSTCCRTMTVSIVGICFFSFSSLLAQTNTADSSRMDETIISSLRAQFRLTEYDQPNIIVAFNKDTILVLGYLSDPSIGTSRTNAVYKTTDGGFTWGIKHFKGDASIYCAHFEKDGKVWMGGSDEFVHYSNDYGNTWIRKKKPFKSSRVLSLYMTDSLNGLAGGLSDGVAITTDNWKTTKQIPSPLEQHKFKILENSARNRIDKIAIIDSIILIEQNSNVYYSELHPIVWKKFNIPVTGFSPDKTNKQWLIYSLRNKVYVLSAKLDLLKTTTYTTTDPFFKRAVVFDTVFSLENFLATEISKIELKAVRYDPEEVSGLCMPYVIFKENVMKMKIKKDEKITLLKEILTTSNNYLKPQTNFFSFDSEDFRNYDTLYTHKKRERNKDKEWGGDFNSLLNIENDYFLNPQKTIGELDQSIVDSVYVEFSPYDNLLNNKRPYLELNLINTNSDTLQITSEHSILYSLPWTIKYKEKSFRTYDSRIIQYLKTLLPCDYNYYDELLGGELIYRFIEQRTINELEYIKGF